MSALTVAWLGDVVGRPGRGAVAHAAPLLRERHGADVVIANGENARHGRGCHPDGYAALRDAGVDLVTLGDHILDDQRILPLLEDPDEPIARPANLVQWPGAKASIRVPGDGAHLRVVTLLGRLFMRCEVRCPFETLDGTIEGLVRDDPGTLILLEVHAEATSEKIALLWHCRRRWPDRVLAVVGTHTHVQTSDARIVDGRTGAITDLGMCGGRRGVIGFDVDGSLRRFAGLAGAGLDVAPGEPAAEGCLITLDADARRATTIRPFRIEIPE